MDQKLQEQLNEDFGLFIEAGFLAVKQLDEQSARRLFYAAQELRPESTAPDIGLGYIALNKLEVKEATEAFLKVTEKEPENHLAQTFLGMCYLLTKTKRDEGKKIIKESVEKTDDPTIVQLGKIAMEWCESDLEKKDSKSPFFAGKQEEDNK